MNSTECWPDWEKVTRPDDSDLADHPWYHQYFKRHEAPFRPTRATNNSRACLACVARGIACTPRPSRACLQCKTRKTKCSQSIQTRVRSVSQFTPAPKRASHDPPLNPTENCGKSLFFCKPTWTHSPNLALPAAALALYVSRATDVAFDSREGHDELFEELGRLHQALNNVVKALKQLEASLCILQDRLMTLARVVEYRTR